MAKPAKKSSRKPKTKRTPPKEESDFDLKPNVGDIVQIYYANDETGPAPQEVGYQTIADVVFTQFLVRSRVEIIGNEHTTALLLHVLRMLGFDCVVLIAPAEEKAGLISVAHIDAFDPELLVKAIGLAPSK
jgi:hypothetical protein